MQLAQHFMQYMLILRKHRELTIRYYSDMNQKDWEASIAWSMVVAGCVVRREDGRYLLVQEKQTKVYGPTAVKTTDC